MNILVTGSSGMLGLGFNEKYGSQVAANLDCREPYINIPNFHLVDIMTDQASRVLSETNFDICIHFANHARVWKTTLRPSLALENILMNFMMIDTCAALGKPIVIASSREVFGNSPLAFEYAPHYYTSFYALSKGYTEYLAKLYANLYDLKYTIVRYSNVFGRYDFYDRVIPLWIKRLKEAKPVYLYGANKAFNFTYLDDAIALTYQIAENLVEKKQENCSFNVAGRRVFLKYLFHVLSHLLKSDKSELIAQESRLSEVISCNVASKRISWVYTDFRKALKQTVDWYLADERYQLVEDHERDDHAVQEEVRSEVTEPETGSGTDTVEAA